MEQVRRGDGRFSYFYSDERVAVFIDGAELRATVGGLGIEVDFKKILSFISQRSRLVRAHFYYIEREDDEEGSLRPLTDWLEYNGYTTIACAGSDADPDVPGRRRNKNFLNVRLAVDVMEIASGVDHIVIFSGDAVLGPLVEALQWRGRRVSIVSTLHLRPPMVADGLRRRADQFIDLADIMRHIARDDIAVSPSKVPVERKPKTAAVAKPSAKVNQTSKG